jgi:uncharacterized protein with LGFP repeats
MPAQLSGSRRRECRFRGAIRGRWAQMGWERSRLRYRPTDEQNMTRRRVSFFQGGEIRWTPSGGAHEVFSGAID